MGNCHKYRHPWVNFCPTTHYHIWKQRQNPKADKLKATSIQRETHTPYVIILRHTQIHSYVTPQMSHTKCLTLKCHFYIYPQLRLDFLINVT